jgi:phospholipase C
MLMGMMRGRGLRRPWPSALAACGLAAGLAPRGGAVQDRAAAPSPAAVIQHVVVIFQENVSFDHYFATYPVAANLPGEPPFTPLPGTPTPAGLTRELLTRNPNALNPMNGPDAVNPYRLPPSQAATADQDHSYTQEQLAYDHGRMDFFPGSVGHGATPEGSRARQAPRSLNLAYFDGNTVTAIWRYAQRFAMSDHFFQTTFGPSTLGHLNLVAGQTNGVTAVKNGASPNVLIDGGAGSYTVLGDVDPIGDICSSSKRIQVTMASRNIGDLLSAANVSWGWFQGGFDVTAVNDNGTTGCARSHASAITGLGSKDYIAHHEPFQYYPSTANPTHLRPTSVAAIGTNGDRANHQYDLADYAAVLDAGRLPAVVFLKPPAYQNGHAEYSDPLDEQVFLVHVLNDLQQRPEWKSTVVLLTWDDSDGWYDHLMGPIVNSSVGPVDALDGDGICGDGKAILPGPAPATRHALGRCGYGPRLPLLVLSPWARRNVVDSTVTDMTSITRFIEDVFLDGRRLGGGSFDAIAGPLDGLLDFAHAPNSAPLLLDERTGQPQGQASGTGRVVHEPSSRAGRHRGGPPLSPFPPD